MALPNHITTSGQEPSVGLKRLIFHRHAAARPDLRGAAQLEDPPVGVALSVAEERRGSCERRPDRPDRNPRAGTLLWAASPESTPHVKKHGRGIEDHH